MQLHFLEFRGVVFVKLVNLFRGRRFVLLFQVLEKNLLEQGHALDAEGILELRLILNSGLVSGIGKYQQVYIALGQLLALRCGNGLVGRVDGIEQVLKLFLRDHRGTRRWRSRSGRGPMSRSAA